MNQRVIVIYIFKFYKTAISTNKVMAHFIGFMWIQEQ